MEVSSQAVNFSHGKCGSKCEVTEGISLSSIPIHANVGGDVETMCRQIDALQIASRHQLYRQCDKHGTMRRLQFQIGIRTS